MRQPDADTHVMNGWWRVAPNGTVVLAGRQSTVIAGPRPSIMGDASGRAGLDAPASPAADNGTHRRSKGTWHGRLARLTAAIVTVLILAVIGLGITVRTGHMSLMPVLSGSMSPAAKTGDLAVLWQVPTADLKVGDVVSFYPPGDTSVPKMHRIVSLTRTGGTTAITTKGDANRINDPWGTATLRGAAAYRMVGVVPLLGWTAVIGHSWVYVLLIISGVLLGIAVLQDIRNKPVNKQPRGATSGGDKV